MKHPVVAPILSVCLLSLSSYAQTAPATAPVPRLSAEKAARIRSSPAITVSADNRAPSPGQAVHFSAEWDRQMAAMAYHFDFGDGQFADMQNPVADHKYAKVGTYVVRVTAHAITRAATVAMPTPISSNELSIQVTQPAIERLADSRVIARIPAQEPGTHPPPSTTPTPQLRLNANILSAQRDQPVHFTGSWDQNVYRMEYVFDWGDGHTSGTREPIADHAYSQTGIYTVRLRATSLSPSLKARVPAISSNEVIITVAEPPPPPLPPRLTLTADSLNPRAGDSVHFRGRWNRKVPRGRYVFDWGDGQTGETTRLTSDHAYAAPGSYRVRIIARFEPGVRAVTGDSEIVSNEVLVSVSQAPPPPPPPRKPTLTLGADALNPQTNQSVRFRASWSESVAEAHYRFVWGDGQYSESESPDAYHAYSSPGSYPVHVVAKGLANDRYFDSQSNNLAIAVAPPPPPPPPPPRTVTAALKADRQRANIGDQIRFTASVIPQTAAVQYHFVFGDGNAQDSQSDRVEYSYSRAGNFHPWVTVSMPDQDQPATSAAIELVVDKFQSPVSPAPHLSVAVKTEKLLAGKDVVLEALLDPPHDAAAYEFSWGDGSLPSRVGASGVASHRYAQRGSYDVLVTASTGEVYPTPLEQRLILNIPPPPFSWWPPTLWEWIVILAGLGVAVKLVKAIRDYIRRPPPLKPELHVRGSIDAGVHTVARVDKSVPHLSITLKPGMDSAEHELNFPKRAAASD